MTPKEVLTNAIDQHLRSNLEAEGFSFSESQLKFKKKSDSGFTHEIGFRGSKTNTANYLVNFEVWFNTYSAKYKKWWKDNFPEIPIIGGGYLPKTDLSAFEGMNRDLQPTFGYDFMKLEHSIIMNDIWENYKNHAKKYFGLHDAWEYIVNNENINSFLKIDALIFCNKPKEALELAEEKYKKYLDHYGSEENMKGAKQTFSIIKSRLNYLKS